MKLCNGFQLPFASNNLRKTIRLIPRSANCIKKSFVVM